MKEDIEKLFEKLTLAESSAFMVFYNNNMPYSRARLEEDNRAQLLRLESLGLLKLENDVFLTTDLGEKLYRMFE